MVEDNNFELAIGCTIVVIVVLGVGIGILMNGMGNIKDQLKDMPQRVCHEELSISRYNLTKEHNGIFDKYFHVYNGTADLTCLIYNKTITMCALRQTKQVCEVK